MNDRERAEKYKEVRVRLAKTFEELQRYHEMRGGDEVIARDRSMIELLSMRGLDEDLVSVAVEVITAIGMNNMLEHFTEMVQRASDDMDIKEAGDRMELSMRSTILLSFLTAQEIRDVQSERM